MPIEIRELHIKAVVSTEQKQTPATPPPAQQGEGQEALVAACVEQVLEILRDKAER